MTPYTHLNPGYRIYEVDGDHENSTQVRKEEFTDSFELVICDTHHSHYFYQFSIIAAYFLPDPVPDQFLVENVVLI